MFAKRRFVQKICELEDGITYRVVAYRELSRAEKLRTVELYQRTQTTKSSPGAVHTIETTIGLMSGRRP